VDDVHCNQQNTASSTAGAGGGAFVELVESSASGQSRQRVGSIAGEGTVCLDEPSSHYSNKAQCGIWRCSERLQKVDIGNHEARCPLESNNRDGSRAFFQDSKLAEYFALTQFGDVGVRRVVRECFGYTDSAGQYNVDAVPPLARLDDGVSGGIPALG
jgi:hypothetical protein